MPFLKRTVKPVMLRRAQNKAKLFQEFDDVSNYTLTGALLQLASIAHHAEDIFGEIDTEICSVYRRCSQMSARIRRVQDLVDKLDAKKELIPVSDLDVEQGLPIYLHYQSPNSVEEDLFTGDSRTPCIIHLHQRARQDLNHILRGSDVYSKQGRPKSLDPRLLMDEYDGYYDPFSPRSPRNSSFFSSSTQIDPKSEDDDLPASREKMRIETSGAKVDIITVDTSGAKFERQANLRRSQRLASCTVRQRGNSSQKRQLRSRHKTLIGLPGNISSELDDPLTPRPYSLLSNGNNSTGNGTGSSFVDGSSEESRSMINGHVVVSPGQNQRNAEIQTDDVRVIPLTPGRKLRHRGSSRGTVSPTSSHASAEFLESPTAVPCPTVPQKNQTSTPINAGREMDLIRPTTLDVTDHDTSTDEGRHTGESNPTTPVHRGRMKDATASPLLKASPSSPMATTSAKGQQNGSAENDHDIAMRINGARLQQGEDRTSSGFWSGTESTRHSSTSDIMAQHAHVTKALQQVKRDRRTSPAGSPITSHSAGQMSPLVDNRQWLTPSGISSSSVSINSRLSALERTRSNNSMRDDDEDRFPSADSSVISITLSRPSHGKSNQSLNSTDSGTALTAAAMLKKSRKSRYNASSGVYNFMNYEDDPLETENNSISRALKNRRSARGSRNKGSSGHRQRAEDTLSIASVADSSHVTDVDGRSAHSGQTGHDSASLCESTFSVDQEGYFTSMHGDCGIPKTVSPSTASLPSMAESLPPDIPPPPIPTSVEVPVTPDTAIEKTPTAATPVADQVTTPSKEQKFFGEKFQTGDDSADKSNNYNSYQRAVKSNHNVPKSLAQRGKSASVKSPKSAGFPALDFQAELNKRLSLRRIASSSGTPSPAIKKEKRGAAPPPPKRNSSLSNSVTSSPALSHRSLSERGSSPASPSLSIRSSKSPTSPLGKIKEKEKSNEFATTAEMTYMETLPPPPPPHEDLPPPPTLEQLHDLSQPSTPISTPVPSTPISPVGGQKAKRPPPPPKPQRTSSKSVKQAPVTKPKPAVQISGKQESSPAVSQAATGKPYFSTDVTDVKVNVKTTKSVGDVKGEEVKTVENLHEAKVTTDAVIPHSSNSTTAKSVTSGDAGVKDVESDDVTHESSKNPDVIPVANPQKTTKTPPAVLPKFVTSPIAKVPPPVSSKPLTSPKYNAKSNFESRRAREQSPSYRSSLARAAFFGTSPQPDSVVPATSSETKIAANMTSSQTENDTVVRDVEQQAVSEPAKQTPPVVSEVKEDIKQNTTDATVKEVITQSVEPEIATNPDVTSSVPMPQGNDIEGTTCKADDVKEKENVPERMNTPESNDWLGKIEEFSTPNRAPKTSVTSQSPSESAASRLLPSSAKEMTKASPKYTTYENLMAAIHKSKRETLAGKSIESSPPTSPGTNNDSFTYRNAGVATSNGNHSPVSTLERKRNGRLTNNGHRNGISRKSTGGTSRDNFKALLLQNACRGSSGSQMTAAEKLQLNKSQFSTSSLPRQRPHSYAGNSLLSSAKIVDATSEDVVDAPDSPKPVLSLSDIRSAITSPSGRQGRPARRGAKTSAAEALGVKKTTALSVHGKKHPPPSMSSKYNTRSRTPTRPMMSISEDSETEKSPEQRAKMAET